jgi:hypothetical protein
MVSSIANTPQFNSWLLETASYGILFPALSREFIAGVAIPAGRGVYIAADGKIYPYTTANTDKYIGVTSRGTDNGLKATVVLHGYVNVPLLGWAAGQVLYVTDGTGVLTTSVLDKKVAVGVAKDIILVYTDMGNGGAGPVTDAGGYAKSLMLMGG